MTPGGMTTGAATARRGSATLAGALATDAVGRGADAIFFAATAGLETAGAAAVLGATGFVLSTADAVFFAAGAGAGFAARIFDKGAFVAGVFFATGFAWVFLAAWAAGLEAGTALVGAGLSDILPAVLAAAFLAGGAFLPAALAPGRVLLTADVLTDAPRNSGTARVTRRVGLGCSRFHRRGL